VTAGVCIAPLKFVVEIFEENFCDVSKLLNFWYETLNLNSSSIQVGVGWGESI
jgi:hypothetical protein